MLGFGLVCLISPERVSAGYLAKNSWKFLSEVDSKSAHITEGGPPTWKQLIDVDKAKIPGISARIAGIGPPKITSLAQTNLRLVRSATSASPNVPTKIASNAKARSQPARVWARKSQSKSDVIAFAQGSFRESLTWSKACLTWSSTRLGSICRILESFKRKLISESNNLTWSWSCRSGSNANESNTLPLSTCKDEFMSNPDWSTEAWGESRWTLRETSEL